MKTQPFINFHIFHLASLGRSITLIILTETLWKFINGIYVAKLLMKFVGSFKKQELSEDPQNATDHLN